MKLKPHLIFIFVFLGFAVWTLDALFDSLFLEKPIADALFGDLSGYEIFHRLVVWFSFSAFLYLLLRLLERGKKARTTLRESDEIYRTFVESANDGVTIFQDLQIKFVNPSLAKMLGRTPEEMLGTPATDYIPESELPRLLELFKKRMAGRDVPRLYETVLTGKNGKPVHVEVSVEVVNYEGRQADMVFYRDISERKRVEEELRKAQERFKALFDNAVIGFYRTTPDGKILMANPALVKMLGYDSFEDLGRRNLEEKGYEPRYPRSAFKEHIERDGVVVGLESVWLKRDGTTLHIRESARAVREADGGTLYYEGTVEDITDKIKVEEELKKKDLIYKSLVNNPGVGIATTDVRGRFTMVNERLCDMFGYTEEELLGTPFADYLYPEDKKKILKIFLNAWKQPDKKPQIEFRGVRKDGRLVHCFSCPTFTLFDNEIIRFNAIIVDITDMKLTEMALRASEERYRTFTEEAQIGVYIYDNGRLLFVNPAMERITGYSKAELLARDTIQMEMPDEQKTDDIREEIRQQEDTNMHHYKMHLLRKDGEIAILEFQTHPIVFEERNVTFGTCIDITETRRNEERLKEVIAEKEVLLREIHHRVTNNLQIISSLLYLSSENLTESEAIAAFRESQNRIKIMAHIHEMLYQSQDTGSIFLPVYLADIVSSIFSSYSTNLGNLDYELDIDDVNLGIDTAIPLGLCVNELVANSIEHAFPDGKGRVSISLKNIENDRFSLRIADSGVGFAQGTDIGKAKSLGLQLVTMMVEQLQGELELHRKNPTAFTITFSQVGPSSRGAHLHG